MRMKLTVAVLMTASTIPPCLAQTAVGVGIGTAKSSSASSSRATAIGGGAARATASPSVTIQGTQVPVATTSTINNTGTQTIRNVPTEFAPGLAAAGLETCLGSISGGGAFVGTGFSFGSTIPDPGCAARLDARTLWSFGLKKAAIARLCLGTDIYNAMPEVCYRYLPARPQPVYAPAVAPAAYAQAAAEPPYRGGPIMLVEGKTGLDRLCNDYDSTRQRCRVWDGVVSHHAATKKGLVHGDKLPTTAALTKEDTTK